MPLYVKKAWEAAVKVLVEIRLEEKKWCWDGGGGM